MSLYIDLCVNSDLVEALSVTRTTTHGSDPESVNFYRWAHCDGALALTHKAIGDALAAANEGDTA